MSVSPSVNELQDLDVYKIPVMSDKGVTDQQCPTQQTFLSFLQVPQSTENPMCLVARWDCENCDTLQVGTAYPYSPCSMNIDIENETLEASETNDRTVGISMKTEGALARALRWKISLQIGGKIMQLLMNPNIMLPKCSSREKSTTERTPDTPNNRWGRYRRAASFDSRKVAFTFSLLSIIGTIVLIYLTLRVKQAD